MCAICLVIPLEKLEYDNAVCFQVKLEIPALALVWFDLKNLIIQVIISHGLYFEQL